MQEDSCGVPLVLRDGFGGFLPQRLTSGEDHEEASLLGCPPTGLLDEEEGLISPAQNAEALRPALVTRGEVSSGRLRTTDDSHWENDGCLEADAPSCRAPRAGGGGVGHSAG